MRPLKDVDCNITSKVPFRKRLRAVYQEMSNTAARLLGGVADVASARRFLYSSSILLFFSGCVSVHDWAGGHTNAFPGPDRSDSEVATITTPVVGIDEVSYGGYIEGYPMNVKVLPGTHRIRIRCDEYRRFSLPLIRVTLQAGKSYEQYCVFNGDAVEAGLKERG